MPTNSPSWFVLSQKATENLQQSALIPALTFTSLALVVVLLRWYSRIRLAPGTWHREDMLISVALVLSISMTAVVGTDYGVDASPAQDAQDAQSTLRRLSTMLKLIFAQSLLYQLAINLVKTAFTCQYLRVFSHLRYPKYYCYVLLVSILGATTWGVFGIVFLCNPIKTYWDVKVDGKCMNAEHHFWSTSIVGIVIDWAIWVLPMPIVRQLNLPRRQKWGLWIVFGLGGFVCVVSILRLTMVHKAVHEGKLTLSGTYAVVWSTVELNVAIICASLLVMKPLFASWAPAMVSEQPVSASEDTRTLRRLTGLALLHGGFDDEEKAKKQAQSRRDTAVAGLARDAEVEEITGGISVPRSLTASISTSTSTSRSRQNS
ncbi:integral membrane protein [Stagonosporopsis vannaccii]|nr:integral membrane protein [Stagonosporopsis vannaccii]